MVILEARIRRGRHQDQFAAELSAASGWRITTDDVADFEAGLANPEPAILNAASLLADEAIEDLARGAHSAFRIALGRLRFRHYRRLETSARRQGLGYQVENDLAHHREILRVLGCRLGAVRHG